MIAQYKFIKAHLLQNETNFNRAHNSCRLEVGFQLQFTSGWLSVSIFHAGSYSFYFDYIHLKPVPQLFKNMSDIYL